MGAFVPSIIAAILLITLPWGNKVCVGPIPKLYCSHMPFAYLAVALRYPYRMGF